MPIFTTLGAACAKAWGFTSGLITDQYFNLVSLLLPGNGTNGAQNNTFQDSSPNTFPITRNPTSGPNAPTQGTFSPFSQTGWGNYFNGSSNYRLTIPDSTDLDIPGDFCLEMWAYFTSTSASNQLVCIGNENAAQNGFILYNSSATPSEISLYTNGATAIATSSAGITTNRWHHIALVRNGVGAGNTVIYVDGVSRGSAQITTSFTGLAGNGLSIGQTYNGSYVGVLNAYLSNVRLVNGSPVYTGAFTPPTTPLTAITNTKLLTCQSNRFVDANTQVAAKTITVTGSPSVTPFSPFAPTQSYSAAAVGGSGYFDGNTDWLSLADSEAFNFGNGDFTIEMWTYLTGTSTANAYRMTGQCSSAVFDSDLSFSMLKEDTTDKYLSYVRSGSTNYETRSSQSATRNAWVHIALVRSGGNLNQYINGQLDGQSTALSTNTINNSTKQLSIGRQGELAAGYYEGNIANYRIVKGTAVYTGNFTPPTKPLAASGADSAGAYPSTTNVNTSFASSACSLLLNFTNAGVVDATAKNVLETVGNAQISNGAGGGKWGGGSMRFPQSGTNDYLYRPYDPLLNQLNGNFTIECWIYPTTSGVQQIFAGSINSGGSSNWFFQITSANKLSFSWVNTTPTSFDATSTASISTNTWTYVAAVKNGGTITLYINGSADGTASPTGTYRNASFGFGIGRPGDYNGTYFTGYIDDFRMTIGQARTITASPSAPFALQ